MWRGWAPWGPPLTLTPLYCGAALMASGRTRRTPGSWEMRGLHTVCSSYFITLR